MRLSRGFVIAVSTLSNVAGPVPELGSADFPGEPQNFSITSVAGNEATLSLKATPSVFDLNNSLIANSNFKPEFNIMTPLNPERPPDVYLPFMRFAEITAAEGNVFYTFTPSQDPLSPNYGQYKQAYVTSDVQITSRVLENGTLSGDVFVTARLTPISDDQINIIAAVGRRASRDLLEGLDRVAITQEYLTKIFYRESSYAGPRPSRTEIGEGKFDLFFIPIQSSNKSKR
ncbi:MAG: hypothetical protein L6Q57_07270 [Alphaproteobacteria bacterium]|nr:hypothetical protein [Alphaproteobacteria bacterium]